MHSAEQLLYCGHGLHDSDIGTRLDGQLGQDGETGPVIPNSRPLPSAEQPLYCGHGLHDSDIGARLAGLLHQDG
ncbi:hypothetical protein CF122_10465 [Aeromonas media]|nr:hypothetical protein CF122_10465 [Aeromonas media]